MVEQLKNIYDILREQVDVTFVRSAMDSIDPEQYGPQILIGER